MLINEMMINNHRQFKKLCYRKNENKIPHFIVSRLSHSLLLSKTG